MLDITEANISMASCYDIDRYKVIPNSGKDSERGMSRTAVIIRSDLTYKVRNDIENNEIPEI